MTLRCLAALAGLFGFALTGPVAAQVPMMGPLPSFESAPAAPPPGAAPTPHDGSPARGRHLALGEVRNRLACAISFP